MTRTMYGCTVLFFCLGLLARAEADCTVDGMRVTDAIPAMIGVYEADGKFVKELGKENLVIGGALKACDESLGLVKVGLTSGQDVWVDRADLKIAVGGQQEARTVCVTDSGTRAHDHTEPAVSGMDPKKLTDCVQPPGSARP